MYYRILNGTTHIGATEINSIPMPSIDIIEKMGEKLIEQNDLTEKTCDTIMEFVL